MSMDHFFNEIIDLYGININKLAWYTNAGMPCFVILSIAKNLVFTLCCETLRYSQGDKNIFVRQALKS